MERNQKPCGSCTQPTCDYRRCKPYRRWLSESWKQFRRYVCHIDSFPKPSGAGKLAYYHPEQLRRYLNEGPCRRCLYTDDCDLPCAAYWSWWDARMVWLRWKWEHAAVGGAL